MKKYVSPQVKLVAINTSSFLTSSNKSIPVVGSEPIEADQGLSNEMDTFFYDWE